MKGIPTIASDIYPYTHNTKDAVLCKNLNDWKQKLENLIIDKKLRREIGQKAKAHILSECQYKDHGHEWIDAVNSVIKKHK
jgi:spore maturation protein CgeB